MFATFTRSSIYHIQSLVHFVDITMVMIMSHRPKQQEQKQHKRGETSLNLLSNTAIWKSIVEHTKPTDKSTTATATTTATTTTTPPVLLTPPRPKNKAITSTIGITSASGAEKISSSSSSLQCSAKAVIAPSFDSTCSSTAATAMTTTIAVSRSGADAASRNTASPNTAIFLSPNQQQQQHAVIPVIPLSSSFSSLSNFSSPVTQTTAYNESSNSDSGSCPTSLVVRDVAQQVEDIFNTNNSSSLLPFQQLSASISKDSAAAAKAHTMTREQQHNNIHLPSYEDIVRGALELEQQSALKDQTISSLREKVKSLETKIEDLRQLPTKKISQILVE